MDQMTPVKLLSLLRSATSAGIDLSIFEKDPHKPSSTYKFSISNAGYYFSKDEQPQTSYSFKSFMGVYRNLQAVLASFNEVRFNIDPLLMTKSDGFDASIVVMIQDAPYLINAGSSKDKSLDSKTGVADDTFTLYITPLRLKLNETSEYIYAALSNLDILEKALRGQFDNEHLVAKIRVNLQIAADLSKVK